MKSNGSPTSLIDLMRAMRSKGRPENFRESLREVLSSLTDEEREELATRFAAVEDSKFRLLGKAALTALEELPQERMRQESSQIVESFVRWWRETNVSVLTDSSLAAGPLLVGSVSLWVLCSTLTLFVEKEDVRVLVENALAREGEQEGEG